MKTERGSRNFRIEPPKGEEKVREKKDD